MTGRILLYAHAGRWRLGASYRRAFERLGWDVDVFDVGELAGDLHSWLRLRVGRRLSAGSLALRRLGSRRWNARLQDRARDQEPDLLFLIGARMVMPETVRTLQDLSGKVAVFFPDDPTPGASEARPEQLEVAREADRAFVWSRRLAEKLEEQGAGPSEYLPFAWDPVVFPHVSDPEALDCDVVFVGGWDRYRERWLEPVARRFDLRIWGPAYWGERTRRGSRVREAWQGGALRGQEAARVIAAAPITLNVFREQNLPDGTNMRTFEVPGAGGFLLSHRSEGATAIYPEGRAGAYFDSRGELGDQLARYLSAPDERDEISARAHRVTRHAHQYTDRARRILQATGFAPADAGGA